MTAAVAAAAAGLGLDLPRDQLAELRIPQGAMAALREAGPLAAGAFLLLWARLWESRGEALPDDDRRLAVAAQLPLPAWRRVRAELAPFLEAEGGRLTIPLMRRRLLLRTLRRSQARLGGFQRRIRELLARREPDGPEERAELVRLRAATLERDRQARRLYRLDLERFSRGDPSWSPDDPSGLDPPEPRRPSRQAALFGELAAAEGGDIPELAAAQARLVGYAKHQGCLWRSAEVTPEDMAALGHLQRLGRLGCNELALALMCPGHVAGLWRGLASTEEARAGIAPPRVARAGPEPIGRLLGRLRL